MKTKMNRPSKNIRSWSVPPAHAGTLERLDAALSKNTPSDADEKINGLRLALFGSAACPPNPLKSNK
jgi:hypothetical protein